MCLFVRGLTVLWTGDGFGKERRPGIGPSESSCCYYTTEVYVSRVVTNCWVRSGHTAPHYAHPFLMLPSLCTSLLSTSHPYAPYGIYIGHMAYICIYMVSLCPLWHIHGILMPPLFMHIPSLCSPPYAHPRKAHPILLATFCAHR